MAKRINKKKIVGTCPVGINKTRCPSIKATRQIRVRLMASQKEKVVNVELVQKLRAALKERKNRGIAVDCNTCGFNAAAKTAATAS